MGEMVMGTDPRRPSNQIDAGRGKESAARNGYLVAGLILVAAYIACVLAMSLAMAGPPDPGAAVAALPWVLAAFAPLGMLGAALAAISRVREARRGRAAAVACVAVAGLPSAALLVLLAAEGRYAPLLIAAAVLVAFAAATVAKPGIWPAFALLVLVPLVAFSAYIAWAGVNGLGSSPSYRVGGYGELRADLVRDCPGIRFPDLSRYGDAPGFEYTVTYVGGRASMRDRGYLIANSGGGAEGGMKAAASEAGVDSEAVLLEVSCDDLRIYDGGSRHAPEVNPNMERAGVGVERASSESDAPEEGGAPSRDFPAGSRRGECVYRFAVGGYLYRVAVTYRVMPGAGEDAAREVRGAAEREARDLAFSIIDQ